MGEFVVGLMECLYLHIYLFMKTVCLFCMLNSTIICLIEPFEDGFVGRSRVLLQVLIKQLLKLHFDLRG